MMFDLPDPPKLWLPPKPAIIRSSSDLVQPKKSVFFCPPPFMKAGGFTPFDAAYVAYAQQTPGSTTITQSIDVGAADSTKVSVIAFGGSTNTTISSATIDGVSATVLQSAGNNAIGALIYAAVPAGGTVNVVLVTASTVSACAFASYRLVGTGLSATPSSTSNPAGGGGATRTATLTNTAGGVSIIECRGNNADVISNVDTMDVNTAYLSDNRLKTGIDYPTTSGSLGYASTNARQIAGAHWAAP